jgi:aminoglycoside 6-adenylyltransferase
MSEAQPDSRPVEPNPAAVARAYERIVQGFAGWARDVEHVRFAAVVGSRARSDHPADAWADLDILVLSEDAAGDARRARWVSACGEPWISFLETTPDGNGVERRVLFDGGLDVDFAFFDVALSREKAFLELARGAAARGIRVLIDRELTLERLGAPAEPMGGPLPDRDALHNAIGDFWYHAVWTAKHLRRGELWWAKGGCDGRLKDLLRAMLEWDATLAGRDAWFRGRYLEEWADPAVVQRLRGAFARYDPDDVWRALEVTMDLFAEVARRTAASLGLPYPVAVEAHARDLVDSYAPRLSGGGGDGASRLRG